MKKLLTVALLAGSTLSAFGQYNPYVNLSSINPTPLQPAEENGSGTITFHVGNSGSSELFVPTLPGVNGLTMVISLSYGQPNTVIPTNSIGGTYANRFLWLYDALTNSFFGSQILPIPSGGDGTITIAYKVSSNSSVSLPQNGFNVNLTPPAYSNGPNSTLDDNVNKYVYTVTVISGTVFNDDNAMTDNLVNGVVTNIGGILNAVLINSAGNVTAVVPVAANGTYFFPEIANGDYTVMITIANPAVGSVAPPTPVLPPNWFNTGEGLTPAGDGTANGQISVVKGNNSVVNANFGIKFTTPLPVDLITFDAEKRGAVALLDWKTSNESKLSAYEVERSINGVEFVKIGSVAATNASKGAYDFTDQKPVIGVNFYRLKMVDIDGKFTYSKVKQLEFADGKMDLVLYPNPTTNELNIEFRAGNCGDISLANVSLFDISGRMVISKPWEELCNNPVKVIDLSGLTDGAYFITVRDGANDAIILNKKIIKTK